MWSAYQLYLCVWPIFRKEQSGIRTDVILIPPLESHLQIVVVRDHFVEFRQKLFTLVWIQFIDVAWEWPYGVNALPPCDGICANLFI